MANSGNLRHVYAVDIITNPSALAGLEHRVMNSNLQIRLFMRALLSLQPGCVAKAAGSASGPVLCFGRGLGMRVHPPRFWSLSAALREVGWQGLRGSTALQVIGSLTAPPTLAPPLSRVCRTQIQRYQRAAVSARGPAGTSRPLRSPSLTWSGGWTRLWLCFAARLFLGITTDGRCRECAGCGAGACWEPCWGGHGHAGSWGPGPFPPCRRCPPSRLPGSLSRSLARWPWHGWAARCHRRPPPPTHRLRARVRHPALG